MGLEVRRVDWRVVVVPGHEKRSSLHRGRLAVRATGRVRSVYVCRRGCFGEEGASSVQVAAMAEDKGYGGEVVVVGGGRERRSCKLAWVGAWAINQARELREEGCSSTPTARIRRFGGVGEDR